MPWPIVLYESREAAREANALGNGGVGPAIGAMWPITREMPDWWVSDEYRRDWAGKRPPHMVQLPSGPFCIDSPYTDSTHGWDVTGDPPNVTLSPSINVVGYYHGWIQNGVITEDCEGRRFPA